MFSTKNNESTVWMNVSDLFSVLFLVFLLLSLLFITVSMTTLEQLEQAEQQKQVVKKKLKEELQKEFSQKMQEWQAEFIDSTLSIRFYSGSNKILFKRGSAQLEPYFQQALTEFFPTYLDILYRDSTKHRIHDIRIEGHTSSEGEYFANMFLSQQRANSVLRFLFTEIPIYTNKRKWLLNLISSNGLGAKNPLPTKQNPYVEDANKSRRVEIKLVLREPI